jgi:hypothetical protein
MAAELSPKAEQALQQLRVFHKTCGDCAKWGAASCPRLAQIASYSPACTSFEAWTGTGVWNPVCRPQVKRPTGGR